MKFWPQSAMEVSDGTAEDHKITESINETVSFLETNSSYSVGSTASHPAASIADATLNVDLANFLSRPVKIYSYVWSETDAVGTATSISPWQLFFANNTIKNKLDNYAWLRCDLKLKIMLNASPFYYGASLVSYQPLPNFKGSTISNDSGTRYFIPLSQRPHLWLYPQNNEGGEMMLPFFLFKNYISTVSNQDFLDMGTLSFTTITDLASANGAVGTGVTISVYAWAENVVVSGPTAGLIQQSKDEYGKGPISSVASAIASAAKALTGIPIIKPYATATQMGMEGVSALASKLGYCNTPVISDTMPFRNQPLPVLASTEQGYPIEKMTIDPKNELSIDPQIVGLPPIDELNIQHLVGRESYLCTTTWSSADAGDKLLFQSAVLPAMFDMESTAQPRLYMTPMAYTSQLFGQWRGDLIFRFRFIATQYHRGRVRVIFDPSGSAAQNITNTVATQAMCFNEVIDLTKDTNVELRIPYNQSFAWLKTFTPTSSTQIPWTTSSTPTFNHVAGTSNGSIAMRVVTALTGPTALFTIPIIVSVRGADNLEFGNPQEISQRYTQFAVQSKDEYEVTPSSMVIAGNASSRDIPEKYLINLGEKILTLRQLLRRYNLAYIRSFNGTDTNSYQFGFNIHTAMPPHLGYDPSGQYSAKGLINTATNYPYNYVSQHPLNYISSAFIGYRGSINYSVTVNNTGSASLYGYKLRAHRVSGVFSPQYGVQSEAATNLNTVAKFLVNDTVGFSTAGGCAVTQAINNNGLNYAFPMYSRYKFLSLDKTATTSSSWAADDRRLMRTDITFEFGSTKRTVQNVYCGIGTDWNCHFFLNVPTFYVMSGVPNPT